ncbi:MAG: efflux RND transporter permease subunit [Aliarcobacter sp.]|nr:efflux RND transporter permease subunit [Aliarcobacter sp.]
MYNFALNRPITVLMGVLTFIVFGIMSYKSMPVNLFPNIDFPVVTIQTTYNGADALTVESKVTDLIEESVSGIDGIDKITSSSFEGFSSVAVQFVLERDITEAANDVRDKIGAIDLPSDVESPIVSKVSSSGSVINLFISDKAGDSQKLMLLADEKIKPKLQRVKDVGEVDIIGFQDREIRIFVNPDLLNKYNISALELQNTISTENYRASAGKVINDKQEIIIKSRGDALKISELKNINIKESIKLSDIATVFDGLSDEESFSKLNGVNGVMLTVEKISGTNALNIIKGVKNILPELEQIAGENYKLKLIQDESKKILVSLNQVKFDLVFGAILAVIIVFFFLRNVTATILSAFAIPISIIGTFAVIDYLGYDLNKLSLIGLTLAIGIFIDDAIVVIENIMKRMEEGLPRFEATLIGTKEIAFSVLGISAMLLAVFIPVAFMDGMVGKFFNSFAMTVASGVVISYLVAIMFIPAFGSRMLSHKESKFFYATEPIFQKLDKGYVFILRYLIKFKYLTILGVVALVFIGVTSSKNVGMDFVPVEDNSEYQVLIKADIGISINEMKRKVAPIVESIEKDENTVDSVLSIGYTDSKESHKAKVYVRIKPLKERTTSQSAIIENFRKEFSAIKDMVVTVEPVPTFSTGESNANVQVVVRGDTLEGLNKTSKEIMAFLKTVDGAVDIDSDFDDNKPEYKISILRENAKKEGVTTQQIANLLSAAFSSDINISTFEDKGKQYDITLRLEDSSRKDLKDIKKIYVRANNGSLVSLDGLVKIEKQSGVATINRYDRERKVMVTAYKTDDVPLDSIVSKLDEKLPELLPPGYTYKYTGEIERMQDTVGNFGAAILLAIILIYLILAALYESIIQPVIIMVSMPLSIIGVLIALSLTGMNFSLYVMIGIILLLGMVGKNAVLVVDFANQAIKEGKNVEEALLQAGEKRLRPILMTTFAMVGAMLPLALGSGAGHESNAPMSIAVIGGLISSTILTLLVVPAIYRILYPIDAWLRKFYEKENIQD